MSETPQSKKLPWWVALLIVLLFLMWFTDLLRLRELLRI